MKLFKSLPARLLLALAAGIALGLVFPENVMVVVVTLNYILGQLITFCVPLIIIGFIAPSITKLGNSATRMLAVAVGLAYLSSILAALLSMGSGYAMIPHLHIASEAEGLRELPQVAFQLDIPQIMSVMSALAFSVLVGLAAVWTHSRTVTTVLLEFQNIVLELVKRVLIPILPFYIATTFCDLAWEGSITKQLPVFLDVILIVMVGHYLWMVVLYGVASLYSGHSGIEVVKRYGTAYLTAVGTMSCATTLAVALQCPR